MLLCEVHTRREGGGMHGEGPECEEWVLWVVAHDVKVLW